MVDELEAPQQNKEPDGLLWLNLRNKHNVISFHPGLHVNKEEILNIDKISPVELADFLDRYPPNIAPNGKNTGYILLDRHLIYKIRPDTTEKMLFRFRNHWTPTDIERCQEFDKEEASHLLSLIKEKIKKHSLSESTQRRNENKEKGHRCQRCPGALLGPRNGKPHSASNGHKLYRMSCQYAHMKKRNGDARCDYFVDFSEYEFNRFQSDEGYACALWWQWLDDKHRCPKCSSRLGIRIFRSGENEVAQYVTCEHYKHSTIKQCTYVMEHSAWKSQNSSS